MNGPCIGTLQPRSQHLSTVPYRDPEIAALVLGDFLPYTLLVLLEDHGLVVHASSWAVQLLQLLIHVPQLVFAAAAAAGALLLARLGQSHQKVLLPTPPLIGDYFLF